MSDKPFFVVGVDRSGTTLLTLLLDGHSQLWIPNESHFFVEYYHKYNGGDYSGTAFRKELVSRILSEKYVSDWAVTIQADDVDFEQCTDLPSTIAAVYSAHARKEGKSIWGDKTPRYISHIDILNRLFPDARYIHIVRDGRDVASSIVKQWWGANDYLSALDSWARRIEMGHKMLNMLPESRVMEVRFEDLVAQPESHVKSLCAFLGVPFEPGMMDYTQSAASKVAGRITAHHSGLTKAPDISQTFRWKKSLSDPDQALSYSVAGKMLEHYGYESGTTKSWLKYPYMVKHRFLRAIRERT